MVALQGDKILPVPLEEAVSKLKTVNMDLYTISKLFFGKSRIENKKNEKQYSKLY
jgi:hypothetical protein